MNTEEAKHRSYIMEQQERSLNQQLWSSCLNCEYWDKSKELCSTYAIKPPIQVIVIGCAEWLGEIPF